MREATVKAPLQACPNSEKPIENKWRNPDTYLIRKAKEGAWTKVFPTTKPWIVVSFFLSYLRSKGAHKRQRHDHEYISFQHSTSLYNLPDKSIIQEYCISSRTQRKGKGGENEKRRGFVVKHGRKREKSYGKLKRHHGGIDKVDTVQGNGVKNK